MKPIVVFAGTKEGRKIAEYLAEHNIPARICVATEYGQELLPTADTLKVSCVRLNELQMEEVLEQESCKMVIDATHPYAVEVTRNCKAACERKRIPYYRVFRQSLTEETQDVIQVESVLEAVDYLRDKKGNVLVTTGSKEMASYLTLTDAMERLYFRVLSTAEVVSACKKLGIEGRHLFAMQGPFGEEMNYALLKEMNAAYMVTKESGQNGGFEEKLAAAKRAGVTTIVVGRPAVEDGYSFETIIQKIQKTVNAAKKTDKNRELSDTQGITEISRKVYVIGIGTGSKKLITIQAVEALQEAQIVFGAKRMLEAVKDSISDSCISIAEYQADKIAAYLEEHIELNRIAVLYSGDIGFYSGAKQLRGILEAKANMQCIPIAGISAPLYFMDQLGIAWEDAMLCSMHGRNENILANIKNHKKVVVLLGDVDAVSRLSELLIQANLLQIKMVVGENLSYPNEKILIGSPEKFLGQRCDKLAMLYLEHEKAGTQVVTHGMEDAAFIRDKVPMTKMEVRSISLSKLQLTKEAVLYDIGAGTGSIAIEAAMQAGDGQVYAIEKEERAQELLQGNKQKFGVTNLMLIRGKAPEALEDLPLPTHAFIGGSAGALDKILGVLYTKNPKIRVVMNVIALESLAKVMECVEKYQIKHVEYVQVAISKSKEIGSYQMMTGQNPVYVITLSQDTRGEQS